MKSILKFLRVSLILTGLTLSITSCDKEKPVDGSSGAGNVQQISCGYNHTLLLMKDGTLWAWGDNKYGQLGNGTNENSLNPIQIGSDNDWVSVNAAYSFSIALKRDGTLWTWGRNESGRLGDGTTTDRNTPAKIGEDNNWKSIATGHYYASLALKTDGSLWIWGAIYPSGEQRRTPIEIGEKGDWQTLSYNGGTYHVINSSGELWGWGNNSYSQITENIANKQPITQVGEDKDWVAVSAGTNYTLALKRDGTLFGAGINNVGQLGIGTINQNGSTPLTQIGEQSVWAMVSAASTHSVALKKDGTIWAWGENSSGQLGDGTTENRVSPVQINLPN